MRLKIPFDAIEDTSSDVPLDETDMLARSIRMYGLLMPLTVMQNGEKYLLVHGFRRYKALKLLLAGEVKTPVEVTIVDGTDALKAHNERVVKRNAPRSKKL